MKILSLVWFQVLPARFGGQKGTALFNEYLGREAELVCLCSKDNVPDGALSYKLRAELPVGKKQVAQPSVWRQIADVVQKERPTHLLLEYPYHSFAAVRAKKRFGLKLVLHAHNIEYARFRRLRHPAWRLLKAYEGWAFRKADAIFFKTEEDQQQAVRNFGIDPSKTSVVPYGVEIAPDKPGTVDLQEAASGSISRFLFAGTLDYAPNAAAVQAIYEQLAPRLDRAGISYTITICGRNQKPEFSWLRNLSHPKILQNGEVASMDRYYEEAGLFINPVLTGGGVQTKVLDSIAAGCPVLSFEYGARGIDREACGTALTTVADGDWDSFVAATQKAAPHHIKPSALFEKRYSWQAIAGRALQVLQTL